MSRYNQRNPDWRGELDLVRDYFAPDREQLSTIGMLLSGAMTEQLMQRRVYDRRRNAWENAEQSEQIKATAAAENRRFAEFRVTVEKQWLAELRDLVLTDAQKAAWPAFERARRIHEMLYTEVDAGLAPTALLHEIELTPEERAALAEPLERAAVVLDDVARKYLELNSQWLSIRWGKQKGDEDKVDQARSEVAAKIPEALQTALRLACDALPSEKGHALRTAFELRQARSDIGLSKSEESGPFAEILKISTLSDQQRTGILTALRAADLQIVKEAHAYTEARRQAGNDWDKYEKAAEEFNLKRSKAQRAAYKQVREILTDDQRRAFDDGVEPPIGIDDLHIRYDAEDQAVEVQTQE